MISLNTFLKIFKDTNFERAALEDFYHSIKKTVILLRLGKPFLPEVFKQEERYQWAVLQLIDDPNLPIYDEADAQLLSAFIRSIEKEKKLRLHKRLMDKVKYWSALQDIIEERADLFKSIFDFSHKDERSCNAIADRYKRALDSRKRRTALEIGLGAGAAAAGAAALWYLTKKDKK